MWPYILPIPPFSFFLSVHRTSTNSTVAINTQPLPLSSLPQPPQPEPFVAHHHGQSLKQIHCQQVLVIAIYMYHQHVTPPHPLTTFQQKILPKSKSSITCNHWERSTVRSVCLLWIVNFVANFLISYGSPKRWNSRYGDLLSSYLYSTGIDFVFWWSKHLLVILYGLNLFRHLGLNRWYWKRNDDEICFDSEYNDDDGWYDG